MQTRNGPVEVLSICHCMLEAEHRDSNDIAYHLGAQRSTAVHCDYGTKQTDVHEIMYYLPLVGFRKR